MSPHYERNEMRSIANLVSLLRSLPGFEYAARNGVTLKLAADESFILMSVQPPAQITDDLVDDAIHEAFYG
jgi:hypothetical protein